MAKRKTTPETPLEDAQLAYEEAEGRARKLRAEWVRQGQPLMEMGSMRQPIVHPLITAIEKAEAHADKLRQRLQKRVHRGPDPKAVVQPSIGVSPATKLRAVK